MCYRLLQTVGKEGDDKSAGQVSHCVENSSGDGGVSGGDGDKSFSDGDWVKLKLWW